MFDSVGELPAHPLFVHAPIVLMPLLTLFALVLAARPAWRRQIGFALPALSAVLAAATLLARESGFGLEEFKGDFAPNLDKHISLANTTLGFIVGLLVISIAMVVADRRSGQGGPDWLSQAALALVSLSVVVAGLATVWMFRTGHEGARLHWKGTVPESMASLLPV